MDIDLIRSLITKYRPNDIKPEPEIVGKYLSEYYNGERLLIYGDGAHSHNVLKHVVAEDSIIGILEQEGKDDTYVSADFTIPIYNIKDLAQIRYDKIVLLGYWSEENISEFSNKFNIPYSKLLLPYLTDIVMAESSKKCIDQHPPLNLDPDKETCFSVSYATHKSLVYSSLPMLTQHLNVLRISINADKDPTGDIPNSPHISLENDLYRLLPLYERYKPITVLFWVESPFHFWQAWYTKYICKNAKFIIMSSDFTFNDAFSMSDEKLQNCLNMNKQLFCLLKESELSLIKESDGLITNIGGEFTKKLVKKYNQKVHFTYSFINKEYMQFEAPDRDIISLCYTGSMDYEDDNSTNYIKATLSLKNVFRPLLRSGYTVDAFNSHMQGLKYSDTYTLLENEFDNFNYKDFIHIRELPKTISNYHYGLICYNLSNNIQYLKPIINSLMQGKLLIYLVAGLPILIQEEFEFMAEYVTKWGVGIVIPAGDPTMGSHQIKNANFKLLKENVKRWQEHFASLNLENEICSFIQNITRG